MRSPSVNSDMGPAPSGEALGNELERPARRGVGWLWLGLVGVLLLIAAFTARSIQRGDNLRLRGPAEAPPGVLPTQGTDRGR